MVHIVFVHITTSSSNNNKKCLEMAFKKFFCSLYCLTLTACVWSKILMHLRTKNPYRLFLYSYPQYFSHSEDTAVSYSFIIEALFGSKHSCLIWLLFNANSAIVIVFTAIVLCLSLKESKCIVIQQLSCPEGRFVRMCVT